MYRNSIPESLEVNSIYDSQQLIGFVCENPDAIILTDVKMQSIGFNNTKYKIIDKQIKFSHISIEGKCHTLNIQQTIYTAERI
jgi:hypothetical protein